jgi:shikimate kinase
MVFSLPLTERNLILTGYIEPNKPRIGRQVAERLKMRFIDVEAEIEQRVGEELETIRSSFGERRVKAVEDDIMQQVVLYRQTVLRINGSTLMHSENLERLLPNSIVICPVARLDAILQGLHLALGARYHDPAERAAAMGELKREWAIRGQPGVHELDATDFDETTLVHKIVALWQELAIERG